MTKEFETGKVFPFASQQITFNRLKRCRVKEQTKKKKKKLSEIRVEKLLLKLELTE